MSLFRRRPKVILLHCRSCLAEMHVVADSVPAREQLCNSCAIREARHGRHAA